MLEFLSYHAGERKIMFRRYYYFAHHTSFVTHRSTRFPFLFAAKLCNKNEKVCLVLFLCSYACNLV